MPSFEDKSETANIERLKSKSLGATFSSTGTAGMPEDRAETARIERQKAAYKR